MIEEKIICFFFPFLTRKLHEVLAFTHFFDVGFFPPFFAIPNECEHMKKTLQASSKKIENTGKYYF